MTDGKFGFRPNQIKLRCFFFDKHCCPVLFGSLQPFLSMLLGTFGESSEASLCPLDRFLAASGDSWSRPQAAPFWATGQRVV